MSRSRATALRGAPLAADVATLLGIASTSVLIAGSAAAVESPRLIGIAILLDLTVVAALVHGVLGVRLGGLPTWTLAPVAAGGWLFATVSLPPHLSPPGSATTVLVVAVELAILGLAIARVRTIAGGWREALASGQPGFTAFEAGLSEAFPKALARWFRTEAELLHLCAFGWRRKRPQGDDVFSHDREVSWPLLVAVLCFLSVVEGGLVHGLLFMKGWHAAAWVATALHVYAIAWIVGDMHALRLRPTRLRGGSLELSLGLRAETRIPVNAIESVELGEWDRESASPGSVSLRLLGPANLTLRTSRTVAVRTLLGTRETRTLHLQVDDPAALARALAAR